MSLFQKVVYNHLVNLPLSKGSMTTFEHLVTLPFGYEYLVMPILKPPHCFRRSLGLICYADALLLGPPPILPTNPFLWKPPPR